LNQPPASPPTRPERSRSARQTRDRIARAALDLFTTVGFRETTTPAIAAKAGVAEGTIYRHFPSKDALLNEVYRAAVRTLLEPCRNSDPALPAEERLATIADRWATMALKEPNIIRLGFGDRFTRLLDDRSRASARDLRSAIEQIVAAGKAAAQVRAGPADLWAELWVRVISMGLDRVAGGAWHPDDAGFSHVRQAAWDAVRVLPLPPSVNPATIHDPVSPDPAPGAVP